MENRRKYQNDFFSRETMDGRIADHHNAVYENMKELDKYTNPAGWNEYIEYLYYMVEVTKEISLKKEEEKRLKEYREKLILDSNTIPMGEYDFLKDLWDTMGGIDYPNWSVGKERRGKYMDWELEEEKKHNKQLKEIEKQKKAQRGKKKK